MKIMPSKALLFVWVNLALCCCSVKEDRSACPCLLTMDLSAIDTSVVKVLNVLATSSDGIVFSDIVQSDDFSFLYAREVPHKDIRVTLWGTAGIDDRLDIPYGCECPALYMHAFDADTSGETFHEIVDMKKNHCRLTVLFDGEVEMPYSLTFRGNVCGYDYRGLPSEGDFACVAYPEGDVGSQITLPRQLDSSLMLDVEDEGSSLVKTFAIGEYLVKSGYDWTEADLEDVTIILDYYVTGITITYKGWDEEHTYNVTI